MAFLNSMALALEVAEANDIPQALITGESKTRPLTEHVQWWSYIYGHVVANWPTSLMPLRSDLVRGLGGMEWFEEGLNRGARAVPAGFEGILDTSRFGLPQSVDPPFWSHDSRKEQT
jgi:hypothetical protein